MSRKNKNRVCLPLLILCLLAMIPSAVLTFLASLDVYALNAGGMNMIALQNQAKTCYNSGSMNSKISNGFSIDAAFKSRKGAITLLNNNNSGGVYDCRVAFNTLNSLYGKTPTALNLGYTRVSGDSGDSGPVSKCVALTYTVGGTTYRTDKVCFAVRDGNIDMATMPSIDESARGNGGVYVGWDMYSLQYSLNNEPSTQFSATFYSRTWDEFIQNIKTYVTSALDGRHVEFKVNNTTVSGDIHSPTIQESIGNDDSYVSYEITDFEVAKNTMLNYYFGTTQSKQFTWEQVREIRKASYQLAIDDRHVIQRTCVSTKTEALAQTTYAHYDSASNKWCPVDIESRDKNGELTANKKYVLVENGREALGLYDIESVLQLETDSSEGYDSVEEMCTTQAQNRLQELRTALATEIAANGSGTDKGKYLQISINTLSSMIRNNQLVKNGSVCVDLPSVEEDVQTQKNNCTTTFTNAKTALQNTINGSSSTANEKADAQDKLAKIDALGGVYWDEDSSGSITCKKLEDVYNGTTGGPGGGTAGEGTGSPENNNSGPSCITDGDALGWVLCPVLKALGSATAAVYDGIVQDFLVVDASLFNMNGEGANTYEAWTTFRNYANILFAIAFAVIILAQVTGIGISNYNVKKILPKLVMVAVLVNISFIICQFVIDISNILGSSIYTTLTKMPTGKSGEFGVGNIAIGFLSTIGTGTLIAGTGAALTIAAFTSPGSILLPLLLGFLSAVFGLLFFFVLLAVRKAGIVILVVLAPAAIVCYALPNTKSLFDRWKKLFTALLMVYPICSTIMGGGYFVSSLLLKGTNLGFVEALTAMLIQIVPIFFIPSILRSSMALAGNIGARISNFGSRLSSTATGAIRNAEATKRAMTAADNWGASKGQDMLGAMNKGLLRVPGVGRVVGGIERSRVGKALGASHQRRVAQNKMAYRKMRLDEGLNSYVAENMTEESIARDVAAQDYKQQQQMIDDAASAIVTGNAHYTDASGVRHTIRANEFDESKEGSLAKALDYYMGQFDATGDTKMLTQANAIAKVLMDRGGDKGRTSVIRRLKRKANASGVFTRTGSFNGLAQYISRDAKWMGGLKAEDPGAFRLVGDAANFSGSAMNPDAGSAATMSSLQSYNIAESGNVSMDAVPSLSDDFYEGYTDAQGTGVYTVGGANYDQAQADDLIKLARTFEQAMADPRVAQRVKPKDLTNMNNIHQQAYEIQKQRWLHDSANAGKTEADFIAKFGERQALAPGQQLKVIRSKAELPAGWRRADYSDVQSRHGQMLGLKQGEWIMETGSQAAPIKRMDKVEDIMRAEAIEKQRIEADIQNSL